MTTLCGERLLLRLLQPTRSCLAAFESLLTSKELRTCLQRRQHTRVSPAMQIGDCNDCCGCCCCADSATRLGSSSQRDRAAWDGSKWAASAPACWSHPTAASPSSPGSAAAGGWSSPVTVCMPWAQRDGVACLMPAASSRRRGGSCSPSATFAGVFRWQLSNRMPPVHLFCTGHEAVSSVCLPLRSSFANIATVCRQLEFRHASE